MSTSDIIDFRSLLGQMASSRHFGICGSVSLRRGSRIRRGGDEGIHRSRLHQTIDHVFEFLQATSSSIVGGARLRGFLRDDSAVLAIGWISSLGTSAAWLLSITFQFPVSTSGTRQRTAVAFRDAIIGVGRWEDGSEV